MAVKRKISKAVFDALSEALKAEYKAEGDNYILDIEGDDDIGNLLRAKDRESQGRKEAEARLKSAEDEVKTLKSNTNHEDVVTLTKSWQGKLDTQKAEADAKISALEKGISSEALNTAALKLATELSPNAPVILLPHIKSRMKATVVDGKAEISYLDKDLKDSALTLDEVKAEFVANKDFSAIIKENKSSGGAPGVNTPKGFGGANTQGEQKDLSKMNPAELAAHLKASKTES